ncbi:MAG: hypothetical protein C4521_13800 [Actinobacteria bacterium]|jgi:hypothetical protein|nr:MAG: hypothetical protein C4521_13800 [Actinomycetota bacterium]
MAEDETRIEEPGKHQGPIEESAPPGAEQNPRATARPEPVEFGTKPVESAPHHRAAARESAAGTEGMAYRQFQLRLDEAHLCVKLAANKLRQLEDDSYRYLTLEEREEIAQQIDALSRHAEALRTRCAYCRRELSTPMGTCAVCGRDVCNECGQAIGDVTVHRGNCAMFYAKKE